MSTVRRAGWDYLALSAVLICVMMAGLYIGLMAKQGDLPVAWFLGGLVVAAGLAFYGASRPARWGAASLAASGAILCVLGVLGILSIGLPILIAGIVAIVAAVRSRIRPAPRP